MLGETKLVPPRKGKNANYLSIKHVYLRVARGDFLERMGQQFLNYAGGAPKLYINRLGLLPDTHDSSSLKLWFVSCTLLNINELGLCSSAKVSHWVVLSLLKDIN